MITHIVFGDSAAGSIKYCFKLNNIKENIIRLSDDYSVGPLYDLNSKEEKDKRVKWILNMLNNNNIEDITYDRLKRIIEVDKAVKEIGNDSKIIIWYGKNTSDQIALRLICSILNSNNVYGINVSKYYYKEDIPYRCLGECSIEDIKEMISNEIKIREIQIEEYKNDWINLCRNDSLLRIYEDGVIKSVNENYYDLSILKNCSKEFIKAGRVVGATMGKSFQLVGDTYIEYRLRKLIEEKKVEYCGTLESLRDYSVRLI